VQKAYDIVVVGGGPAGMMAAIVAAEQGKRVAVLEKLSTAGVKLKATGGGRCNLTNTLETELFMEKFGKQGRFMRRALTTFNQEDLRHFFDRIGVKSHAPDGFRVFPLTHSAATVTDALVSRMKELKIDLFASTPVSSLYIVDGELQGVVSNKKEVFLAPNVIVATGGQGYPVLGAEGDGYHLAQEAGHTITPLHPAMMPLHTKERWVERCRADTIPKVTLQVNMKKYKKMRATGDLIFTKQGIRGPVVLDFSREITPILAKYDEVPLLANFTKGMNQEEIREDFKQKMAQNPHQNVLSLVETLLPHSLAKVICELAEIDLLLTFKKQKGVAREKLIALLAHTPLTVVGHEGFAKAMITRGGVSLKEIDPDTMQSKRVHGLFFCGEVVDLDGPCGGYNLQWSFSSGYLAGVSAATIG